MSTVTVTAPVSKLPRGAAFAIQHVLKSRDAQAVADLLVAMCDTQADQGAHEDHYVGCALRRELDLHRHDDYFVTYAVEALCASTYAWRRERALRWLAALYGVTPEEVAATRR